MDVTAAGQSMLGQDVVKTAADKSSLNKDDFMKLMLAELQHQDPLAPKDSKEFLAQLAQLSSLEQLQNMNDSINTLSIVEAAGTNSQTVNYIGKTITARSSQVSVGSDGKPAAEMHYLLPENADSVDITITDANGKVVRTIKAGAAQKGQNKIDWDGTDDSGKPVSAGDYKFDIAAVNKDGGKIEATTEIKGKVAGVTYESGYPELMIGGTKVVLGDVISVDNEVASENGTPVLKPVTIEKIAFQQSVLKNMYNLK